jgi:predicted nucleotidyltransferase
MIESNEEILLKHTIINEKTIKDIVDKIAVFYNPDKVILFGSYAEGNPNYDSDLDILIIKESDKPRYQRSNEIRKYLLGTMLPMDILVYTEKELDDEMKIDYSFIHQAMKTSIILYERNN